MKMDAIYSWIKNIAFCMIIITAVLNILPNNGYKKYVRVFTGIVLLIVIISPLDLLGSFTSQIDKVFQGITLQTDIKEMSKHMELQQESYYEKSMTTYKEEITNQINEEMKEDKYVVKTLDFTLGVDQGMLGMEIVLKKEDEIKKIMDIEKIVIGESETYTKDKQALILKVKNFVKDFYNIDTGNINISIQR